LINKLLKTRVKEEGSKETISLIGSPQGSNLTPLLSNIMLHEFDMFMEDYITSYNRGKGRRINPEYERLWKKYGIKAARQVPYFKYDDPSYRRIHYVRFADDFIITIIGKKSEAIDIKNKCADFLNDLKLTLSPEKTLITNPRSKPIPFLGYLIQKSPLLHLRNARLPAALLQGRTAQPRPHRTTKGVAHKQGNRGLLLSLATHRQQGKQMKQKYSYSRIYGEKLRQVSVIRGGQVYLKPDFKKVVTKLAEKGFCLKNGYPIPNFSLLNETQYGTIIKVSQTLRGLASYYKLARNYRYFLSRTNYIIRYSTAKLFAAKFNIRSIAKVFARAGKDLSRPLQNKATKSLKSVQGQTEEKISEYFKSIGVSQGKIKDISKIGVGFPYTTFNGIPKPELAPLKKDFNPTLEETLATLPKSKQINPLNSLNWRITRTVKLSGASCIICGTQSNVEMHHIRGVKYLKGQTVHSAMMKTLNRTQVPLCSDHQKMAHKN
jgi:hypothetical protein